MPSANGFRGNEQVNRILNAVLLTIGLFGVPDKALGQDLAQLPGLVERVAPSVVSIIVEKAPEAAGKAPAKGEAPAKDARGQFPDLPADHPLNEFFKTFPLEKQTGEPAKGKDGKAEAQKSRPSSAEGTGMVLSAEGYVVTARNVLDGAKRVSVRLPDGTRMPAEIVGTDARTDVAVLKARPSKPLTPVVFGNSDTLRRGQPVFAIGNPFGLDGSVTLGIVSSIDRDIGSGPYNFIQTDAAINRGSSGGPLFDLQGNLVGMNVAIYSPSGGWVGIGFAVPSNLVKEVSEKLLRTGTVARGWIGVKIQNISDDIAKSLGMAQASGALIAEVTEGGPGARAGLQKGDAVVSINGREIADSRAFARLTADQAPNTEVTLRVMRGAKLLDVRVRLGTFPATEARASAATPQATEVAEIGLWLTPPVGAQKGVQIARVTAGSDSDLKGLRPGDVIVEVGEKAVSTPAGVQSEIQAARSRGRAAVLVRVETSGQARYIALNIGP